MIIAPLARGSRADRLLHRIRDRVLYLAGALADHRPDPARRMAFVLLLVRGSLPGAVGRAAYLAAVALYALIAVIAVVPSLVTDVGLSARALQVEAVLLSVLVFSGVNVAWLLLFDETPAATTRTARR
jgi:hypothetical protein